MMYDRQYMDMFYLARNTIRETLEHYYEHLKSCKSIGYFCGWEFIVLVAEQLTAYNELAYVGVFFKMEDFNKTK